MVDQYQVKNETKVENKPKISHEQQDHLHELYSEKQTNNHIVVHKDSTIMG